ncbi:hypothetical protein [Streptomyces sp. ICC4]|uniref:hypothetical protein n=1 Tax=Streptomyces sp. ICC4 TaxID=2099584 RepID=UPI0013A6CA4C|nr:hypothetical protein [Streptomyces sp. ICC4]
MAQSSAARRLGNSGGRDAERWDPASLAALAGRCAGAFAGSVTGAFAGSAADAFAGSFPGSAADAAGLPKTRSADLCAHPSNPPPPAP